MTESERIMEAHHKQELLCFPDHPLADGERAVWITPAFEARDPNPSKNFGIGSCQVTFAKRKGNRVVDCSFLTDWYPYDVQHRNMGGHSGVYRQDVIGEQPLCQGLYRHELVKPADANEWMRHGTDCLLTGGECWGEIGSALYGEEIRNRLLAEGSVAIWDEIDKALEEW